jgi:choline dehydrogenase-like flavoprotein
MDHFTGTGATAEYDGFPDQYYSGRRPTPIYIPRFRNLPSGPKQKDFVRGYGFQGIGSRLDWQEKLFAGDFGPSFKEQLTHPGPWTMWLGAWGETLPYYDNKITLDKDQKDRWGLPLVRIAFQYHDNETAMRKDIKTSAEEMLDKAGFKNIHSYIHAAPGGSAIHEMGTVRMGRDPKTSALNAFNQLHDVKNVFITDGSCMTSAACQNPSLTYMALTARACDYAVNQLKKGEL